MEHINPSNALSLCSHKRVEVCDQRTSSRAVPNAMTSSLLQSSDAIMSIRHFLSPILRRFRSGNAGGGGEMEAGNENGCDDDNDIFDVLDDKENHQRGGRITMR